MKRLFSLLIVMLAVMLPTKLWAQEPYAVLTTDYNTILDDSNVDVVYAKKLTFYYDNQKTARNGMSIGPFTSESAVGWAYDTGTITTVEFDASFANYHPTSTSCWFYECRKLTTIIGIENLRTDQVTDMIEMFCDCSSLTTLDLSGFNTANVTNMAHMFLRCTNLNTIYVGEGWTTASVTESVSMFTNCTNLVGGAGTTYDDSHVDAAYAHIDGGPDNPGYFTDIADKGKVNEAYAVLSDENTKLTFYYDKKKESRTGTITMITTGENQAWINLSSNVTEVIFDESFANYTGLTSTEQWFWSLQALTSITNLNYLNTANVTNMSQMFGSCSGLLSLDLSNFNTSKATDISQLFTGCEKLTSLDLSNFDTSNVTDMNNLFRDCRGLTSIDLSSFNTTKVTDMWGMFMNCDHIKVIDISSFNTSNVTNMNYMFAQNDDSHVLKTIYVGSGWSTESVSQSEDMFSCCYNLWGGRGSSFDAYRDREKSYARLDGGFDNPGYFTEKDVPLPYTVLDSNVFTFYYDKQMDSRDGMIVGEFYNGTPWHNLSNVVTSVFFDESFANCTNLTTTSYWFSEFSNLESITGLDILKTDNVVNMQGMFNDCQSLKNLNVSSFNTSNVNNMRSMFWGCKLLTELDLSNFNTSKVSNMSYMFTSCDSLTTIYVGNAWTIDAVNSGENTFLGSDKLVGGEGTTYDYNHVDYTYAHIDGGTDNPGYFTDIADFGKVNEPYAVLSDENTVLTLYYDKKKAERNGIEIGQYDDVSRGWNNYVSTITNLIFDGSFANCTSITSTANWFYNCSALTTIQGISNLKTDNVTDMRNMFANCSSLTSLDVSGFKTDNVTDMNYIFGSCSSLTKLDVSGFKTDNVTDMYGMFYGCNNLINLDVSGFKTNNVTNMYNMFNGCSNLTTLDVSGFKTDNVTNMENMFSGCSNLTSLDVSRFNTQNVTNMRGMFTGCSGLTSLDVTGFNTQNVTSMGNMFYGCSGLMSLDVTGFNTQNVTSMWNMFSGCSALTTIYVGSEWSTANVTESTDMFAGCTSLVGGMGTAYDAAHNDAAYAHIDEGETNPGYFTPKTGYVAEPTFAWNADELTMTTSTEGATIYYSQTQSAAFNFNSMVDEPCSTNTDNDGDITEDRSLTVGGVTLTISPSTSSFPNRFWSTANGPQLRVYGGMLIFSSTGNVIKKIVFNNGRWNDGNSADIGSLESNVWRGEAQKVEVSIAGNTQLNSIEVYLAAAPIQYTAPVTVTNDVIIQAYAEKEGMGRSTTIVLDYPYTAWMKLITAIADAQNVLVSADGNENVTDEQRDALISQISVAQSSYMLRTDSLARINQLTTDLINLTESIRQLVNAVNEPYTVLSDNNTVLTFYYDNKKVSRGGTSIVGGGTLSNPFDVAAAVAKCKEVGETASIDSYYIRGIADADYTVDSYKNVTIDLVDSEGSSEKFKVFRVKDKDGKGIKEGYQITKGDVVVVYGPVYNYKGNTPESAIGTYLVSVNGEAPEVEGEKSGGGTNGAPKNRSSIATNDDAETITTVVFDESFANCTTLTSTANWFSGFSNLTTITGIENLKTDNVTSMTWMFQGCSRLTSLDVSGFKTDNVTDMATMFSECSSLTSLDVSGFKTENVKYMGSMFTDCSSLTSLNVSGFKTDNVTDMGGMFTGCSSLTNLDVSSFNTAKVTFMRQMFGGCSGLTSLDLSNFNTSNVTDMYYMFLACSGLKTIYVGDGWSTANVEDGGAMFDGCTNLVGDQGTAYDAGHTDVSYAHWDGGTSNPGYLSRALQMGDANGDGSVNIADAVATVTHILGETGEGYFYTSRADMNSDSVIDIFDVTMIINAVFDATTPAPAITRGNIDNVPAEAIRLTADANSIYMDVDQAQQYTAFQFDMSLPEGMSLVGIKLVSDRTDHQVLFVQRGENEYRVVGLSMSNEVLSSADGHLIQLQVSNIAGESNVKVSNVLFVTPAGKTVTVIDELLNTTMATDGNIYNLKGEKLGKSMQQLGKGIYIMNHKKVIIK